MQGYRVVEEFIIYTVGKYKCELIFSRCNELHKHYPIYDIDFFVDKNDSLQMYKQSVGEVQGTFSVSSLKSIIPETIKVLNNWCCHHPYTFVSFFDCLSNLYRLYLKIGFVSDGRGETFVAYINAEGKRTAFRGMLNLLEKDDFWVNDLWRVAKDCDYYIGNIYTPVDSLKKLLSSE